MRKVIVVAVREYNAAVRTKGFLISLLIMPLLLGGTVIMEWLLRDLHDVKDRHFAVVDRTPGARLFPAIQEAVARYDEAGIHDASGKQVQPRFVVEAVEPVPEDSRAIKDLRARLSDRVRSGELFGFLEIGPDVFQPGPGDGRPEDGAERRILRYQSNHPTHRTFPELARRAVTDRVLEERCAAAGMKITPGTGRQLFQPMALESRGLSRRNPATGEVEEAGPLSQFAPVAVPLALMMLMYLVVLIGSTPLMQGVVEEKMQRIAEVLLGSVQPFQLMLGKLLGMTAVSLTISAVYLGCAYWSAHHYGFDEFLETGLLAWFLVFQVLAALMYGSLFIAVGAACTDMRETQNLMWPVMLLATLPLFFVGAVLREPDSAAVMWLSFFPFATPTLMVARLAVPPGVPGWQPVVGMAGVLATTLACVWAAGRVFRVGILLQGKGARPGEVLRWVFRA